MSTATNIEASTESRHMLRLDIEEFNAEYCAVLDDGDLEDWPKFFEKDGFYNITSRENYDRGLPVGLVYCEGRAMMEDRALAIAKTSMFGPRFLRHYLANTRVTGIDAAGVISSEVNYILVETVMESPKGRLHQAGRMVDRFARQSDGQLLLRSRICVYDTLLVPNALVLPV